MLLKNAASASATFLESQPGKVHVIVTFLAILELMKTGKIRISQEELFRGYPD